MPEAPTLAMERESVLRDCLESLKHLAVAYSRAAFECDTDGLRRTLSHIVQDKHELQAAVFNLMHQMGAYQTRPADAQSVQEAYERFSRTLQQMEQRRARVGAAPEMVRTGPTEARYVQE